MTKRCFSLFFSGFNVIVVYLCVCLVSCKSVTKGLFFSVLGGFCGMVYSCLFGFRRFMCFSGSCFCFFCLGFVFGFLVFFLFCCWIVFGVVLVFHFFHFSFFVFCFLFFGFLLFVFCLFEGFKSQVRWPKGPPLLALNSPYFLFFCVVLFLFVFLSLL